MYLVYLKPGFVKRFEVHFTEFKCGVQKALCSSPEYIKPLLKVPLRPELREVSPRNNQILNFIALLADARGDANVSVLRSPLSLDFASTHRHRNPVNNLLEHISRHPLIHPFRKAVTS